MKGRVARWLSAARVTKRIIPALRGSPPPVSVPDAVGRAAAAAVRWRRMKITFLLAGAVGAACAAVYGDGLGGIVATFGVFGTVTMLLYWGGSRLAELLRT